MFRDVAFCHLYFFIKRFAGRMGAPPRFFQLSKKGKKECQCPVRFVMSKGLRVFEESVERKARPKGVFNEKPVFQSAHFQKLAGPSTVIFHPEVFPGTDLRIDPVGLAEIFCCEQNRTF